MFPDRLLGGLGALILVLAAVFGIPWIRLTLSTVSTDRFGTQSQS
jgi:hypothetical protein